LQSRRIRSGLSKKEVENKKRMTPDGCCEVFINEIDFRSDKKRMTGGDDGVWPRLLAAHVIQLGLNVRENRGCQMGEQG
jgi:hypothetical protein